VFPARYELNSYIVFRKRLVSKRLTKHYVMKTYGGVDVDQRFLDLDTSWSLVVSFTLQSLYPQGKSPR
jgi:steroid 5-alpha reductase family enzyme